MLNIVKKKGGEYTMTDKIMKDSTLEDENADAFAPEDMSQEDESGDVNSKGGQASDEGLDEYEVGSSEAAKVMKEEDEWGESSESDNKSKSQSES